MVLGRKRVGWKTFIHLIISSWTLYNYVVIFDVQTLRNLENLSTQVRGRQGMISSHIFLRVELLNRSCPSPEIEKKLSQKCIPHFFAVPQTSL